MRIPARLPPDALSTVGHSTRPVETFLDTLREHRVTRVADVRRFAGSRRDPRFQPLTLQRKLAFAGIGYTALTALGSRRRPRADTPNAAWRHEAFRGYADYMDTSAFADAAGELAWVARVDRVAIMCAEAVWWRCRRSMIADAFEAHGWTAWHLLGAGAPRGHPYTAVARIVDGELTY